MKIDVDCDNAVLPPRAFPFNGSLPINGSLVTSNDSTANYNQTEDNLEQGDDNAAATICISEFLSSFPDVRSTFSTIFPEYWLVFTLKIWSHCRALAGKFLGARASPTQAARLSVKFFCAFSVPSSLMDVTTTSKPFSTS